MKKKILLTLVAFVAVAVGVVGMSAFEAHVINVTATIKNALSVDTTPIEFGTVFPQEELDYEFEITLSQSFIDTGRVDNVDYMIRQKPKCKLVVPMTGCSANDCINNPAYTTASEDSNGNFVCQTGYEKLPVLCPYLSKHELTEDVIADGGIDAFHGDMDWTMDDTISTQVLGQLTQSKEDILDLWNIDLRVPCFEGECAQDWASFVYSNNKDANADDYILPAELKNQELGCDLWIEVTGISEEETCGIGCP